MKGSEKQFDFLTTVEEVRVFVQYGYWAACATPLVPLRFGFTHGRLPLAVAEPGPLIEHAVALGGQDGLTLQQVRDIFSPLGKERLDRGLAFARSSGRVEEQGERRPNRAGRLQEQVVLHSCERWRCSP